MPESGIGSVAFSAALSVAKARQIVHKRVEDLIFVYRTASIEVY